MIKVQENNINPVEWTPRSLAREWNRKDRAKLSFEISKFLDKDDVILDVASGGAIEIKMLRECGVENKIDACDFWEKLRDYYETKPELNISNYFTCDLAIGITVPDKSYDVVLACEVLEHMDDPKSFIFELLRVARKKVIITCPYKDAFKCDEHVWQFDADDFRDSKDNKFLNSVSKISTTIIKDRRLYILAVYTL